MGCDTGLRFNRLLASLHVCLCLCFRLEELLKAFLDDPDPDVTLSLGPDMRKIQHCFSLLKVLTEPSMHTICIYVFLCNKQFVSLCVILSRHLSFPVACFFLFFS